MLQHLNRTVLNRRNKDGDDYEGTARILQVGVVAGRGEKCHGSSLQVKSTQTIYISKQQTAKENI